MDLHIIIGAVCQALLAALIMASHLLGRKL